MTRVPIATVTAGTGATTVLAGSGSGSPRVTIPCCADVTRARRWLGSVRRIARVEIEAGERATTARAWGLRHRLPFSMPIPVAVALGLTELGVPTTVVTGRR